MSSFDLIVNGKNYAVEADGQMPLLWILRDLLGLTGTKFSCGEGLCGSCTVLVDGTATRSCILPVERVAGKNILTIEGLSVDGSHPLQKAWIEERVTQCGYCQAGQIMTAAALLEANPNPSDEEIDAALGETLCPLRHVPANPRRAPSRRAGGLRWAIKFHDATFSNWQA